MWELFKIAGGFFGGTIQVSHEPDRNSARYYQIQEKIDANFTFTTGDAFVYLYGKEVDGKLEAHLLAEKNEDAGFLIQKIPIDDPSEIDFRNSNYTRNSLYNFLEFNIDKYKEVNFFYDNQKFEIYDEKTSFQKFGIEFGVNNLLEHVQKNYSQPHLENSKNNLDFQERIKKTKIRIADRYASLPVLQQELFLNSSHTYSMSIDECSFQYYSLQKEDGQKVLVNREYGGYYSKTENHKIKISGVSDYSINEVIPHEEGHKLHLMLEEYAGDVFKEFQSNLEKEILEESFEKSRLYNHYTGGKYESDLETRTKEALAEIYQYYTEELDKGRSIKQIDKVLSKEYKYIWPNFRDKILPVYNEVYSDPVLVKMINRNNDNFLDHNYKTIFEDPGLSGKDLFYIKLNEDGSIKYFDIYAGNINNVSNRVKVKYLSDYFNSKKQQLHVYDFISVFGKEIVERSIASGKEFVDFDNAKEQYETYKAFEESKIRNFISLADRLDENGNKVNHWECRTSENGNTILYISENNLPEGYTIESLSEEIGKYYNGGITASYSKDPGRGLVVYNDGGSSENIFNDIIYQLDAHQYVLEIESGQVHTVEIDDGAITVNDQVANSTPNTTDAEKNRRNVIDVNTYPDFTSGSDYPGLKSCEDYTVGRNEPYSSATVRVEQALGVEGFAYKYKLPQHFKDYAALNAYVIGSFRFHLGNVDNNYAEIEENLRPQLIEEGKQRLEVFDRLIDDIFENNPELKRENFNLNSYSKKTDFIWGIMNQYQPKDIQYFINDYQNLGLEGQVCKNGIMINTVSCPETLDLLDGLIIQKTGKPVHTQVKSGAGEVLFDYTGYDSCAQSAHSHMIGYTARHINLSNPDQNYYSILKVDKKCPKEGIITMYNIQKGHLQANLTINGSNALIEERLAKLEEAFKVLSDQNLKEVYDKNLYRPRKIKGVSNPLGALGIQGALIENHRNAVEEVKKHTNTQTNVAQETTPHATQENVSTHDIENHSPKPEVNSIPKTPHSTKVSAVGEGGGAGLGVVMGVWGLVGKFGEGGTYKTDYVSGGSQRVAAQAGVVSDGSAIVAGLAETGIYRALYINTPKAGVDALDDLARLRLEKLENAGKVLGKVGIAFAVVSGSLEFYAASEARNGERAANVIGATGGGILAGMGTGALLGSMGCPVIGTVIGGLVGAVAGAFGGGELTEYLFTDSLQTDFDSRTTEEINNIIDSIGYVENAAVKNQEIAKKYYEADKNLADAINSGDVKAIKKAKTVYNTALHDFENHTSNFNARYNYKTRELETWEQQVQNLEEAKQKLSELKAKYDLLPDGKGTQISTQLSEKIQRIENLQANVLASQAGDFSFRSDDGQNITLNVDRVKSERSSELENLANNRVSELNAFSNLKSNSEKYYKAINLTGIVEEINDLSDPSKKIYVIKSYREEQAARETLAEGINSGSLTPEQLLEHQRNFTEINNQQADELITIRAKIAEMEKARDEHIKDMKNPTYKKLYDSLPDGSPSKIDYEAGLGALRSAEKYLSESNEYQNTITKIAQNSFEVQNLLNNPPEEVRAVSYEDINRLKSELNSLIKAENLDAKRIEEVRQAIETQTLEISQ